LPFLDALIQDVTGVKALSLHHDICTVTGEEVVLFTLAGSPRPAGSAWPWNWTDSIGTLVIQKPTAGIAARWQVTVFRFRLVRQAHQSAALKVRLFGSFAQHPELSPLRRSRSCRCRPA